MPLAVQVGNPGSRGQDSRYKFDPTFMYVGPDGRITDGVWHYSGDENAMLSDDRPSIAIPGPPPSSDSDSMYRYSATVPRGAFHPGSGAPEKAAAPAAPEMVPMPKLKMGEQMQVPFVERPFQTGQPEADRFFHDFIAPLGAKYVDKAAFQKDWDAMAAGTPNFAKQVASQVASAVRPQPTNPYGTLGPSPQRVQAVKYAPPKGQGNPGVLGTAGPKPLRPAQIPVRAAPKPAPKPILAKPPVKKPPKRSGV